MTPFVHLGIERDGNGAARVLPDDDLRAPLVEFGDDVVAVEGLVGKQGAELDAFDQRGDAGGVEAMAGHQLKAYEVTQGVGQRQNLGKSDRCSGR